MTDWANTPDSVVDAPVTWAKPTILTMYSHSITFEAPVKISSKGGMNLQTQGTTGNLLSGLPAGGQPYLSAYFRAFSEINNAPYVLEKDLKGLAKDIAKNPSGNFALANDYDAGIDGTYKRAPIRHGIGGQVQRSRPQCLQHLTIVSKAKGAVIGLFASLNANGFPAIQISIFSMSRSRAARTPMSVRSRAPIQRPRSAQVFVSGNVSALLAALRAALVGNHRSGNAERSYRRMHVAGGCQREPRRRIGREASAAHVIQNSMATGSVTSQVSSPKARLWPADWRATCSMEG